MIACSLCGTENPLEASICGGCGRPIPAEVLCPTCGHPNAVQSRFCNQCGGTVAESLSGRVVLPSDKVGGTEQSTPSPPQWVELARLVEELSDESLTPIPISKDTHSLGINKRMAAPESAIDLAMADCVAGNGLGPALPQRAAVMAHFDPDKATAQMANAANVPPSTTRALRKRPFWREPRD